MCDLKLCVDDQKQRKYFISLPFRILTGIICYFCKNTKVICFIRISVDICSQLFISKFEGFFSKTLTENIVRGNIFKYIQQNLYANNNLTC